MHLLVPTILEVKKFCEEITKWLNALNQGYTITEYLRNIDYKEIQ